ncbi:MAG: hypothetical protein KJ578_12635 [Bacteroidetes bacterium]|nr:hypothetical protein [Bacteroidota bacterium]MBU1579578.1 hypothetical protein [Bacteroidota bacterium]MBU2558616.1 hypothetical protein [Bacteroidota bacterium]
MTFTEKTAIAAVIGGTADPDSYRDGGGKPACRSGNAGRFANGAVTGAFVMAFNHLMDDEDGKNVPSKEWIQEKVNAAIEAERDKIQNWIDGGGGALNIDFNFDNFNNSDEAFGLYNNQVMYKIDLMISGETYIVDVVYMPSGNPNANIVTDIIPAGVAAYYGVPRGQQGKFQLHFSSHVFGGKKYLPIIIYLGKPAYLNYINYTRDEE